MRIALIFALLIIINISVSAQKLNFEPVVGIGIHSVNFKNDTVSFNNKIGINTGLNIFYKVIKNIEIGVGAYYSNYNTEVNIKDFVSKSNRIDKDNDEYVLIKQGKGIAESYKMNSLELPVMIRYNKWVGGSFAVFGDVGFVTVLPMGFNAEYAGGKYKTSGYYKKWNLTIDGDDQIAEYGFVSYSLKDDKMPKFITNVAFGAKFAIGCSYSISKSVRLNIGGYFQHIFTSVAKIDDNYNNEIGHFKASITEVDKILSTKFGIRLGISVDWSKEIAKSVKSIR